VQIIIRCSISLPNPNGVTSSIYGTISFYRDIIKSISEKEKNTTKEKEQLESLIYEFEKYRDSARRLFRTCP